MKKSFHPFPWRGLLFVSILLLCTVMALIPGSMDPTGFLNDKLKHAIAFFVLSFFLDFLVLPATGFSFFKVLGLFMFGVLLEFLQDHVGYRQGNAGDLTDILSNIMGITCYCLVATVARGYIKREVAPAVNDV